MHGHDKPKEEEKKESAANTGEEVKGTYKGIFSFIAKKIEQKKELSPFEKILKALISGDPMLLFEELKNAGIFGEKAGVVETILLILTMNEKKFLKLTSTPDSVDDYVDKINKNLVLVVADTIVLKMQAEIDSLAKSASDRFLLTMLQKAKALLNDGKVISMLFIAIQALRYNALAGTLKETFAQRFFDTMFSDLSPSMNELVEAFMKPHDPKVDPMKDLEERINSIIRAFTDLFMPDLKPSLRTIEKLIYLTLKVYKVGGDKKMMMKELPVIVQELGLMFGCDPKMMNTVVAILKGDLSSLKEFIAPFCSIPSMIMDTL